MAETILVERDGPIATVVLNRADKLNALTRPMWQGLGDAVRALDLEGRMTLCNMSIELGAKIGLVAPDDATFEWLHGRPHAPVGR